MWNIQTTKTQKKHCVHLLTRKTQPNSRRNVVLQFIRSLPKKPCLSLNFPQGNKKKNNFLGDGNVATVAFSRPSERDPKERRTPPPLFNPRMPPKDTYPYRQKGGPPKNSPICFTCFPTKGTRLGLNLAHTKTQQHITPVSGQDAMCCVI